MLEATGLNQSFGKQQVLNDVSFKVAESDIVGLLGPSGSGKTSLLRLIMGLERLDQGRIRLGDQVLSGPSVHVLPEKRDLSMVFQEFTLFPHLSVRQNLNFGLADPKKSADIVDELLDILEITYLRGRRVSALSGGEQQRVALTRALAIRPRVLLLDEPFSNIDYMLRDRLYARFRQFLKTHGITTLIATHDHKEAFYFSDRILVMKDGHMIDSNSPKGIYDMPRNPWVAEFFGQVNLVSDALLTRLGGNAQGSEPGTRWLVRPEMLELVPEAGEGLQATVEGLTFYGFYQIAELRLDADVRLNVSLSGQEKIVRGGCHGIRLKPGAAPHAFSAADLHASEEAT